MTFSVPYLELRALAHAAAVWGPLWTATRITFRCDCQPVYYALLTMTSKDSDMQSLLRHLDMIAARNGFEFRCEHIDGVANTVADLLSRPADFSPQALLLRLPGANAQPEVALELPPLESM